ncbi:ammonium transporter [Phytoactinopolyspora halotolerans]|uniref:Ammonium transporter n=1 Tax=Phytoactinopolyspora halotolerans TaxID=1981512 RepID=A0A6L9SBR4_9ACTN|nr:ammonium transporter [Phytoactinopolyspora halotolerans]NEE01958.1 ammonium transporter [Phytoactinopolyspora halotolerans]
MPDLSAGDTAWVLTSAALVLLMTPGLAFFYGGMVRSKAVLNMLMMSFLSLAIVPVVWVLWGYSLAFDGSNGGIVGGLGMIGLDGIGVESADVLGNVPDFAFVAFQAVFAIITVALISGAIAERATFLGWSIFIVLWATIAYFPVANWVWGGGWIAELGAIDFAGGTVVHINAGAAGLALALVLGKRVGWPKTPMRPHNLPFVMLGAGLLWFGWFGFNAGSAVAADGIASAVWVNTLVATSAAILGWLLVDVVKNGHSTTLGAASGAISGLVAITPACAFVSPIGAIIIGLVAGAVCALCVSLKYRWNYDDSLDVVAVHLVGGIVGTLMIGFLATESFTGDPELEGLFYGGGLELLGKQALAAAVVIVFSFVVAYALGLLIQRTVGFRVSEETEVTGIDLEQHLEAGYELTPATGPSRGHAVASASTTQEPGSVNQ